MTPSPPTATPAAKSSELRIVSLLPSATEMVCALGLGEHLVGITHCCDFPQEALSKPRIVHSALDWDRLSLGEIDATVSNTLKQGKSLYIVNEHQLRELAPTLIVTQDLCQVCAPSGNEVSRVLRNLPSPPQVLWMSPHSVDEIHGNLRELGNATGRIERAKSLIAAGTARLAEVARRLAPATHRPRVFCAEWVDPLYCSGHWVPEQVQLAAGDDVLGRRWANSVRVTWDELIKSQPEKIFVLSCGFDRERNHEQAKWFLQQPGSNSLLAVKNDQVFALDAAYFSRPGPRVIEGVELLAHLMHAELCPWTGSSNAFTQVGC